MGADDKDFNNIPVSVLDNTKYQDRDIRQANKLVEACKQFDILEGRLFCLGAMELYPQLVEGKGDTEFTEVKIETEDIQKLFGGHPEYYRRLRAAARKLQGRLVDVRDSDDENIGWKSLNIFRRMEFDKKKGGLIIRFSDDMKPYLLELVDKSYTRVAGKVIFALSSPYAIRIIELMLEWQNFPDVRRTHKITRSFTIKELRALLVIGSKYKAIRDFTRYIVKAAADDINASTEYRMEFDTQKTGRKTIGYIITLYLPFNQSNEMATVQDVVKVRKEAALKKAGAEYATVDNNDTDIKTILIHYGVGKIVAGRLAKNFSREQIVRNIKYALAKPKVRNLGAYIANAVRDDYFGTRGAPKGMEDMFSSDYQDFDVPQNAQDIKSHISPETNISESYIASLANWLESKNIPRIFAMSIAKNGTNIEKSHVNFLEKIGLDTKYFISCVEKGIIPDAESVVSVNNIKSVELKNTAENSLFADSDNLSVIKENRTDYIYESDISKSIKKKIMTGKRLTEAEVDFCVENGIVLQKWCTTFGKNIEDIIPL